MLGVKFPICAFSEYRDAVVAVTNEGWTSEPTWTELCDKLSSGKSPAGERSRSLTGKRARTPRAARTEPADSHDPVVAPVQSSVSSGRRSRINRFAAQCDSKTRHVGRALGWTNKRPSTAAVKLGMVIEFIDADGPLSGVVDQ